MAKKPNPNTTRDAYPSDIRPDSIRNSNDRDAGALKRHEADIRRLDRMHPPSKGGRGK
jgi:hypothetical protein